MEDKVAEKVQELAHVGLTHFDMVIIAIIAISTVIALYRGFSKSFLSIVGWIISAIVAIKCYHLFSPLFLNHVDSKQMADAAGFTAVFVVVAIIITIINAALISLLANFCGGFLDRSFGLLFGFVRGCILVSVLFYCMILVMPSLIQKNETNEEYQQKLPTWIKNSKSLILLHRGAFFVGKYIPNNIVDDVQTSFKSYNEKEDRENNNDRVMKALKTQHRGADTEDKAIDVLLASLPPRILELLEDNDILLLKNPDADSDDKLSILRSIEKMTNDYPNKTYKDSQGKYVSHDTLAVMIQQEISKHSKEVIEDDEVKKTLEALNNTPVASDQPAVDNQSIPEESVPEESVQDEGAKPADIPESDDAQNLS